jgi:hypothetical protein
LLPAEFIETTPVANNLGNQIAGHVCGQTPPGQAPHRQFRRQVWIGKEVFDTCAQGANGLEPWQLAQQPRRLLPQDRKSDVCWVTDAGPDPDIYVGCPSANDLREFIDVPVGCNEQQGH